MGSIYESLRVNRDIHVRPGRPHLVMNRYRRHLSGNRPVIQNRVLLSVGPQRHQQLRATDAAPLVDSNITNFLLRLRNFFPLRLSQNFLWPNSDPHRWLHARVRLCLGLQARGWRWHLQLLRQLSPSIKVGIPFFPKSLNGVDRDFLVIYKLFLVWGDHVDLVGRLDYDLVSFCKVSLGAWAKDSFFRR